MSGSENEEALFGRLRRMVATARSAHQRDRRSILALEADIRALRGELDQRCAALAEQMRAAGARSAAISAYARIGSIARGQSRTRPTYPTELTR